MQKNAVARNREFSLQALFIVVEGFQKCDYSLSFRNECVQKEAILYLWICCCHTIYTQDKKTRIQINNDTKNICSLSYITLYRIICHIYYNAMLVSHDLLHLRRSITILIVAYVLFWFFADNVIFHVLLTRTTNVCINIAEYFFHVLLRTSQLSVTTLCKAKRKNCINITYRISKQNRIQMQFIFVRILQ